MFKFEKVLYVQLNLPSIIIFLGKTTNKKQIVTGTYESNDKRSIAS